MPLQPITANPGDMPSSFPERMKKELADGMAAEFERDLSRDGLAEVEIHRRLERSRNRIRAGTGRDHHLP